MPVPQEGESRKDFVDRCIPYVIEEGTANDPIQAAAICHNIYDRKNKEEKMPVTSHKGKETQSASATDYPDVEDIEIPERLKGGSDGMLDRRFDEDFGEDELHKVKGRKKPEDAVETGR